MTIRKMEKQDIAELAELWFNTSVTAHDFIPEQYWKEGKLLMEEQYLPQADVMVVEEGKLLTAFIAMVDNHIAAIFVRNGHQGRGAGKLLLNYAKDLHPKLSLNVYQKNQRSVAFYQSQGFVILADGIDEVTREKEFIMEWRSHS